MKIKEEIKLGCSQDTVLKVINITEVTISLINKVEK